ncbi:MAG: ATP-binding cassette domain-containing protein [Bacteroidetes bacterium CHB6]|nr:ATP-binding cassette domain-containing protein [Bacteroidetes bacterium CHB6]
MTTAEHPIVSLHEANIYVKKNLILTGVNLHVSKNEFVYLIGKTGSGKSSLLRVLFGDIKLNQGDGNVAGYNLVKLRQRDIPFLRRKLGIVFQDFQLLSDRTAKENLLFVLKATGWHDKNKIDDRINEVLQKVGLSTKGFKMPHELSGGEQQRLAIARALLNEPELILADEPSGNLDPETSNEIMNLFFELSKTRCSVIMATHNYSLIERFPARIIRLETGKVIEN